MLRANAVPDWVARWLLALTGVGALFAAIAIAGFALGIYSTTHLPASTPASAPTPAFLRPMAPSCGEVFFCMNSTDPNPSYVAYATADPGLAPEFPQWAASSAFDVSDPHATTVRVSGVYSFVAFTPIITFGGAAEVAVVLVNGPGVLLSTPVLSGDLGVLQQLNLTMVPTLAAQATAIAHLRAGDSVRVGYVVAADSAFVTPGAYIGGFLVRADA